MSKRRNKKKENLTNVIVVFALLIIIILLYTMLNNDKEENNVIENSANVVIRTEEIIKSENEEELNKLKQMTERNRIEYYVSNFINDVEEENFKDAYDVLNNDFKKNYFSTMNDFKEYAQNKFTTMMNIEYVNFERNGQIYVVWLTMTDMINGNKDSGEEMNFVVKENDFNDFELSFSVK